MSNHINNIIKFCTNCGVYGHSYKKCTSPILSYGIILFKINLNTTNIKDKILILLLEKKHTYAYMDFIRGKYNLKSQNDIQKLKLLFNNMTKEEINNILTCNFNMLWCKLWNIDNIYDLEIRFKKEYKFSNEKFSKIKKSTYYSNIILSYLKKNKKNFYDNTEYTFPKGRRDFKENDLDCAIREFVEETNYKFEDISLINDTMTLDENYISSNNVNYNHKYYIALCKTNIEPYIDPNNKNQINEIKDIKWYNFKDALNKIRSYEKWKKDLIIRAYKYFINYLKQYKKKFNQ